MRRGMRSLGQMMRMDPFLLYGQITTEMGQRFTEWLVQMMKKDRTEIGVVIHSFGGSDLTSFGIYSLLRRTAEEGVIVVSLVSSAAHSNGALIALAADERYATQQSSVLFHRGRMDQKVEFKGNENLEPEYEELGEAVKDFRRRDRWYAKEVAVRCGRTLPEVKAKMGVPLGARAARAFGLVHHVL
jgi:ATP-dependent protease ClpP protease subunit